MAEGGCVATGTGGFDCAVTGMHPPVWTLYGMGVPGAAAAATFGGVRLAGALGEHCCLLVMCAL